MRTRSAVHSGFVLKAAKSRAAEEYAADAAEAKSRLEADAPGPKSGLRDRFRRASLGVSLFLTLFAVSTAVQAVSTTVVISEFRVRGPNGGSDEFIELYNLSAAPVNIGGWLLRGSNNAAFVSTRVTIAANTMLNPGCHFLVTNSSTSGGPFSGAVPGNRWPW